MTSQIPDDYFDDDDTQLCSICGNAKDWVECWQCGGEGFYDETDIDPLEGDEFATCPECGGKGGWYECLNIGQHQKDAIAAGQTK